MSDPFVAEIRVVSFNFAPTGWALCNGQLMPISQNTALFSLLGTFYGGDGKSTFALPNIAAMTVASPGQGPGLSERFIGEQIGSDTTALLVNEIPAHIHVVGASPDPGELSAPASDRILARSAPGFAYQSNSSSNVVGMSPTALGVSGGGLPHNNWSPVLVLNYVIALQGIFPPRS
ncbi:MAG: Tail Collar domain protein [Frankiales bacterium]|jgi:microcystin-dependent protein|nr:Tail Collar domain protein [Frankiales bacterium]